MAKVEDMICKCDTLGSGIKAIYLVHDKYANEGILDIDNIIEDIQAGDFVEIVKINN